jgi:hypothetical protein
VGKALLLVFIALFCASGAFAQNLGDYLLGLPIVLKTITPLALIPEMLSDADAILPGAIALGAVALPNAMLLSRLLANDPVGVSRWRKIVRITDGAMAFGLLGLGGYYLLSSDQSGWGDMAGWISIGAALPMLISFNLDFLPFPMEKRGTR